MVLFSPQGCTDGAGNHAKQGVGDHLKDGRTNGKPGSNFARPGSFDKKNNLVEKRDDLIQDDFVTRAPAVDHFPEENGRQTGVRFQKL